METHRHLRLVTDTNPWHDPRSYQLGDAGPQERGVASRPSAPVSFVRPIPPRDLEAIYAERRITTYERRMAERASYLRQQRRKAWGAVAMMALTWATIIGCYCLIASGTL